jgi:hypothetical protein
MTTVNRAVYCRPCWAAAKLAPAHTATRVFEDRNIISAVAKIRPTMTWAYVEARRHWTMNSLAPFTLDGQNSADMVRDG